MVSDIAPSCPHCGRPFYENVKTPAANPPSQDDFKNSATEKVFERVLEKMRQKERLLRMVWVWPLTLLGVFPLVGHAYASINSGDGPIFIDVIFLSAAVSMPISLILCLKKDIR